LNGLRKKWKRTTLASVKRLLEYDDVMNTQREVIYSKRRNALLARLTKAKAKK
jgi:preprotein translocase subunit SecA